MKKMESEQEDGEDMFIYEEEDVGPTLDGNNDGWCGSSGQYSN